MLNTFLGSPLVMMALILSLLVIPLWRILKRTGHSGWWSLLLFIPLGNLLGLWLLAYARWPAVDSINRDNLGAR